MAVECTVKRSSYHDSVALMLVQREVRGLPGIEEAGVVMGTDANKDLLRAAGLLTPEGEAAGPDDLIIAVRGADEAAVTSALAAADALLGRRRATAAAEYLPRTLAAALAAAPDANLALISVPGRFAGDVAREALERGLHVHLFSDNVPLETEVSLKALARERRRLLMGPDCGTAILGGLALGFANRVRRGAIGVVGAAGTGIQEITSLVHRMGGGISHAIGTGGRDLSAEVGGSTMLEGLAALAADRDTRVIVLVSKPPGAEVAERLLAAARQAKKPVVVAFVGQAVSGDERITSAPTLEDAARQAVRLSGKGVPEIPRYEALPALEAMRLSPGQRYVRGLYSGGTLCYEAMAILSRVVGPITSNTPLADAPRLGDVGRSEGHTFLDLGADEFTVGRLHPMLDMDLRTRRLLQEARDPEVAIILLDVVLGYAAHGDPGGELAAAIWTARAIAAADRRYLVVIVPVCGTEEDPQGARAQEEALLDAGALVQPSNARAAVLTARILEARGVVRGPVPTAVASAPAGPRGASAPAVPGAEPYGTTPPAGAALLPGAEEILALLHAAPRVINVGLDLFAESVRAQGATVVLLDWQPPAGGNQRLMDALKKLGM
ncbi:MAG: acyl-CoA synthetase FdrA [Armatimonadetes bacterium]|nr:acyl-CoA synthetase FdrA [Armatimonadota bacterium]